MSNFHYHSLSGEPEIEFCSSQFWQPFLKFLLPSLWPTCTSRVVFLWAVNSLHPQPLLLFHCMISCLQSGTQWFFFFFFLREWQGHEHSDNPSVVLLAVTGVRSLSEATWLPSGDIIYDANEMWACTSRLKVSDESATWGSSSITEV